MPSSIFVGKQGALNLSLYARPYDLLKIYKQDMQIVPDSV